ncbi:MAG: tetratricopeptide repeat protein [Treponema sp.]|nr:tetratricopeptide repeat protein [Treponema sp.]
MKALRTSLKKAFLVTALSFVALWGRPFVSAQADAAEPVLLQIAELLSAFEFDTAIALFDRIPLPERNSPSIRLLEASVLISAGNLAGAGDIARAVSEAEPGNTEALFLLAAIEGALGRDAQQREALERLLRVDPDNSAALVTLGNLHLSARSFRPAADNFRQVIMREPANPDALLGMARLLRMNQEWEDAETFFDRVVELHPAMIEARSERARFYRSRGRLVEALSDLDEAKRLAPADYWVAIDRGSVLLDMGRRADALEEFNRAVQINPGEFLAYVFTSGLKDEFGDLDGAERHYAILAGLRPDYHYALEGLGLHMMRNERWAEARDVFLEAHRRAPGINHYALLAAINWIRMGDPMGARNFLRQAITRVTRDSLEWHMFRLFDDLTVNVFAGETNMLHRLNQEQDRDLRARMTFYMALFYDIRGNVSLANRHFLMVNEMNRMSIPEWRLNNWILAARNILAF